MDAHALLYLAHLPWDHVWQRPQQLMTRFAAAHRVIYVDPPEVRDDVAATALEERPGTEGVRVLRPVFPARLAGTPEGYWREWLGLLPATLELAGPEPILWVSSPLADVLVEQARARARLVVYDCMDDLASFKDGTPAMREHEARLMALADLVFTGGPSMYEARKGRHPRVHCFPSGVDVAHYAQVSDPATPEAPAAAALPRPRLGYFGVLDERIDWPLIAQVAALRPAWQWLLVGPFAKVAPDELPQAPNIHYLGKQPYALLPSFLKSFDVAIMPFARNEATRFISPTKTLEYLAGGKPVVSGPVPDVVAGYSDIVAIAESPEAWIAAVERILTAAPTELAELRRRARPIIERSTWNSIAAHMLALMAECL